MVGGNVIIIRIYFLLQVESRRDYFTLVERVRGWFWSDRVRIGTDYSVSCRIVISSLILCVGLNDCCASLLFWSASLRYAEHGWTIVQLRNSTDFPGFVYFWRGCAFYDNFNQETFPEKWIQFLMCSAKSFHLIILYTRISKSSVDLK